MVKTSATKALFLGSLLWGVHSFQVTRRKHGHRTRLWEQPTREQENDPQLSRVEAVRKLNG